MLKDFHYIIPINNILKFKLGIICKLLEINIIICSVQDVVITLNNVGIRNIILITILLINVFIYFLKIIINFTEH